MRHTVDRIIVEGADQQGKTTICEQLSEELNWPIVHYGLPPKKFDYHMDYLFGKNKISDRNFLSEIVYSKINKRKCKLKNKKLLHEQFNGLNTVLIYVDRYEDYIFEKPDELYTYSQILKSRHIYRKQVKLLDIPVITPMSIPTLVDIIKKGESWKRRAKRK